MKDSCQESENTVLCEAATRGNTNVMIILIGQIERDKFLSKKFQFLLVGLRLRSGFERKKMLNVYSLKKKKWLALDQFGSRREPNPFIRELADLCSFWSGSLCSCKLYNFRCFIR